MTTLTYRDNVTFANPLPVALSPSRLADFQSCPRRFQHGAVDRITQPATYATAKGNLLHHVFEHLFLRPPAERTLDTARALVAEAESVVLTATVRDEIGLTDTTLATLRRECEAVLVRYFTMEDPSTIVTEGVELRILQAFDGTPVVGILDRLDRAADGSLTIIDYKTGKLPNRNYDTQTFANADLYAALCESELGERPTTIKLLYVTHGETIERTVTEPVLKARRAAASAAWARITEYYERGNFPATPSKSACRFCSFKDTCVTNGVAVVR